MHRNLSKNKMLNISVVALFLAVSFAGCIENDEEDSDNIEGLTDIDIEDKEEDTNL